MWRDKIKEKLRRFFDICQRAHAHGLQRLDYYWAWVTYAWGRFGNQVGLYFFVGTIGASYFLSSHIERFLAPTVAEWASGSDKLGAFRPLAAGIGGALIGATAIAFSVVMFAMQINFARMPYGLFRRLSFDARLLAVFAATFFLALLVAAASLAPQGYLIDAVLTAIWASVITLILFLIAYKRALQLINPVFQVSLLVASATKKLQWWSRRADRAKYLISDTGERLSKDLPRVVFFRTHSTWTAGAIQSIAHAVGFAKSYSALGDYEVARAAYAGVLGITQAYISAKGKTFFQFSPLLGDNAFANDGVVNSTLEQLRQRGRDTLAHLDETAIEQCWDTLANLVALYSQIDYGNEHNNSKHHANLAAGYLGNLVMDAVPKGLADILMHGSGLLGRTGLVLLTRGMPNDVLPISENLLKLSAMGAGNDKFAPVSQVAITELTSILIALMARTNPYDARYAIKEVDNSIRLSAIFWIKNVKDGPLLSKHSNVMVSYYGLTKESTFAYWLEKLANDLEKQQADDKPSKEVIRRVAGWAKELRKGQAEVFGACIEAKSSLLNDFIQWVSHVLQSLMRLAQSPPCDVHFKQVLEASCTDLISIFWRIPNDKGSVGHMATYQVAEVLFEVGEAAIRQGQFSIAEVVEEFLMFWGFQRGHHQTGWPILEDATKALLTLALLRGDDHVAALKTKLADALSKSPNINANLRISVLEEYREGSRHHFGSDYGYSRMGAIMRSLDQQGKVSELLSEIADIFWKPSPQSPSGSSPVDD